jgi:membrane-associated phospholipid phosphatase
MWLRFTNLGDLSIMLPLAVLISVWLLCSREWSRAAYWGVLFGLGGLAVACSKILFIGWGLGSRQFDFTGISGHTMLATSVAPVVLDLGLAACAPAWRRGGLLLGIAFGALIGYSRLVTHAHSPSEVIAGFVLGLAICLLFVTRAPPRGDRRYGALLMLLVVACALNWQFDVRAPGQDVITRIALRLSGHELPYMRGVWRS